MKTTDIDLTKMLSFRPDLGKLLLGVDRMLLFRQAALASLRSLLFGHLGPTLARAVFAQFGKRCGAGDFSALQRQHSWDSEHDAIASGPVMHMWEGIAHVEVTKLEFDRKVGHFHMTGIWRNSYEAEIHMQELGRSPSPVCHSLTGYATGWATAFFERPLLAIETECTACGDPRCAFAIRPDPEWGPEADPWRRALDTDQLAAIGRQELQLDRQRRALSAMLTPILQVWDGVLLVSIIGALDTERATAITAELLPRTVAARAGFVILDLTGIESIDADAASHLLRILQALRLLGADAVVTGVLPAVARSITSSGVNLQGVILRATLRDGLHYCIAEQSRQ